MIPRDKGLFPVQVHIHKHDPTSHQYTCGDEVSGSVILAREFEVKGLSVGFYGRAYSRILGGTGDSQRWHTAECILFRRHTILYDRGSPDQTSKVIVQKHFIQFPFSFKWPWTVELDPVLAEHQAPFQQSNVFANGNGHTLPPSMMMTLGSKIVYCIEVSVMQTSWSSDAVVLSARSLHFIPRLRLSREDLIPSSIESDSSQIRRHSRAFDPTMNQESNLVRVLKGKGRIHTNKEPWVTFRIKASIPSEADIGCSLPVRIALTDTNGSDSVTSFPPVYIHRLRVQFLRRLRLRAPRKLTKDELLKEWNRELEPIDKSFGKPGKLIYRDMEILTVEVPREMTASFKTYCSRVDYTVRLDLWVECAGKVSKVDSCRGQVTVGRKSPDPVEENLHVQESRHNETYEDLSLDHLPPSYEAAVSQRIG